MNLILILNGNAYQIQDETLMSAPILSGGGIDDDWYEVDFDCIPKSEADQCLKIKKALESLLQSL